MRISSASSWGCELKYLITWIPNIASTVSLFVRLWVEILTHYHKKHSPIVSLFVRLWVEIHTLTVFWKAFSCQPLREAVSWNVEKLNGMSEGQSQPLREAVSWNVWNCITITDDTVSLFVRLWVEIQISGRQWCRIRSASSWGCELKYDDVSAYGEFDWVSLFVRLWVEMSSVCVVFIFAFVSLFVRLWVEIQISGRQWCRIRSASSWGCELKY